MFTRLVERFLEKRGKTPQEIAKILDYWGMEPSPELKATLAPPPSGHAPKLGQQMYHGKRLKELPSFAQGVEASSLIDACMAHVACKYTPQIEQQRLYGTGRQEADGDLNIEYEGISANCGAIRSFAMRIAEDDGLSLPYRYVDRDHILLYCCGNPDECRFYNAAVREQEGIERGMRRYRKKKEEAGEDVPGVSS